MALLNVGTFVLFRIALFGWMARWLTVNHAAIPALNLYTAGAGVAVILFMNAVLFYRILNRDFFWKENSEMKGAGNGAQKVAAGADADHVLLGGDRDET